MTRRALPSDPLNLLREGAEVAPPEGAALRVAARLAKSVGAPGAAGVGVLAGASSEWRELAPAGVAGVKALAQRFVRWSLLPLAAGIALGAGGQAWFDSAQLHPQPSLPVTSARAAEPLAPARLPELVEEPPPVLSAEPAPSASPARSTLADERSLLDRARRQLASDEPARALTFLEQHARRYSRGELTEEREAMWVNVLALLGRKEQAKARGEAFQTRFPNSLMGASVRAALRAADTEN
jgi:hypothetical protein